MDHDYSIAEYFTVHLDNSGLTLKVNRKKANDTVEIPLSFDSWVLLTSHLSSVKDYLMTGHGKIKDWKSKGEGELKDPLLTEVIKISDKFALFLSMYQSPKADQDWSVVASLRGYFTRDSNMIPLKKPSILLNVRGIDQLLSISANVLFRIKQERKSHIHDKKRR